MSMNKILITTAIAAMGISSVSTASFAQDSRYGGADISAYEGGTNCNVNPCAAVAAPVQSSRYGGEYVEQAPVMQQAPVYVDCQQMGTCAPQVMSQPTTVYTQPAQPVYSQPAQPMYTQQAQMAAPANCPAGTTAQSDGTCMQTGSSYSTYSEPTTSYNDYSGYDVQIDTSPAPMVQAAPPANCPSGTTAQNDGTCMETGSSYSSSTVTMPGTYNSYSGDAAPTVAATPSYGYTSDGAYTASDYLPIRK